MAADLRGSAAAGILGAMAMTGARTFAGALGAVRQTPPEALAAEAAPGLLARVPPPKREAAVELSHWVIGAAGGAAFGLLPAAVRRQPWAGPAFGLGMWLAFERLAAPAIGLARHGQARPAERAFLAADHLLYGIALAGGAARDQGRAAQHRQ